MPQPAASLLTILGAAILVLAADLIPAEVVGLGIMLALILTGLLPPAQAFAGFGSETVLLILGLLILTAALIRTGVVDLVTQTILLRTGTDLTRLLVMVTLPVTGLSAFLTNTAATAFFLPVVTGLAAKAKVDASRLLMPVAFAAILASSVTLIGTSTNIVISGLITRYGLTPIRMFELSAVGIPIAAAGLLYLLLLGRYLVPSRGSTGALTEQFGIRQYLSELVIQPDSSLIGKTLAEAGLGDVLDLTVLQIIRDDGKRIAARSNTKLMAGDVLIVESERESLLKIKDTAGVDIRGDVEITDPELESSEVRLAEVILLPGSRLIGRTLASVRFRERYGLQILAINRRGGTMRRKISRVRLRMGDVLLVQGPPDQIATLEGANAFHVLGPVEAHRLNVERAPIAVGVFVAALAVATLDLIPLPVAVLAGAVIVFATRCITPEEAYRLVDWKVIILIGSMLALGAAMDQTGTAKFLAAVTLDLLGDASPMWLLSAFFALTVLLTQPMSNQAAAVVVLPIAVQTATQLSLNPRTFAVMIAVAASTSFITPLEPACLMVYGAGRYRFFDFVRVGVLLTILIYLIAITLVPRLWPLYAP